MAAKKRSSGSRVRRSRQKVGKNRAPGYMLPINPPRSKAQKIDPSADPQSHPPESKSDHHKNAEPDP